MNTRSFRLLLFVMLTHVFCLPCFGQPNVMQHVELSDTSKFEQTYQRQSTLVWCWAASIHNIFAYYGHQVSQENIVRKLYGRIVNLPSGPFIGVSRILNGEWVDDDGKKFTSSLELALDVRAGFNNILDNSYLYDSLKKDQPILYGNTHHMMVIYAIDYDLQPERVWVFDPAPNSVSKHQLSQSEIRLPSAGGECMYFAVISVSDRGSKTGFSQSLKQVIREAKRNFKSIRGSRIKHDAVTEETEYSAKIALDGVRNITVYYPDDNGSARIIGVILGINDRDVDVIDKWIDKISDELPKWDHSTSDRGDWHYEIWKDPDSDVSVRLSQRTFSTGKKLLEFSVRGNQKSPQ